MLGKLFFNHPRSLGESYGRHLLNASGFAGTMVLAGCACLVHAFVPGLFEQTASRAIARLHARMSERPGPSPFPLSDG